VKVFSASLIISEEDSIDKAQVIYEFFIFLVSKVTFLKYKTLFLQKIFE